MELAPFVLLPLLAVAAAAQSAEGDARHAAAQEAARAVVQDFLGEPETARYQTLAVLPRGGDAGEPVAEALVAALRGAGRTVADPAAVREASRAQGIGWNVEGQLDQRQIAEILGAVRAQGLILLQAAAAPLPEDMVRVTAQVTLADPAALGPPWSAEVEAEADMPRLTATSLWQRNPLVVGGIIAALVMVWIISARRRRAA